MTSDFKAFFITNLKIFIPNLRSASCYVNPRYISYLRIYIILYPEIGQFPALQITQVGSRNTYARRAENKYPGSFSNVRNKTSP